MDSSVSVDGLRRGRRRSTRPLFDWLTSGDVPVDESGASRVSQTSHDYIRQYWDEDRVTIVGRHVIDITGGWNGHRAGSTTWSS